jgi:hypothetical protein
MNQFNNCPLMVRNNILLTVSVAFAVGLLCSLATADEIAIFPVVEVAQPAPAAEKAAPQPEAAKPQQEPTPAEQAAKTAKLEQKKKADAQKQRAVLQRAVAVAANQKTIEQQMRAQLEPMLKAELSFANRAAELNDDERRTLIAGSKKWFEEFIGPFVEKQDPNQRQMMLQAGNGIWFGGQAPSRDDPRKSIQTGVAKLVSDTLPKEKRDKYKEECRKREEFVRLATVDNLVTRIDEKVILSADQRKKVTDALIKHWDENSAPQLEAFAISATIWPGIPDQWVLPELTESQQAVLSRINRTSGRVFIGGMGFGMGGEVIDDIEFDDTPAPAETEKND